jgi:hypothetical protein
VRTISGQRHHQAFPSRYEPVEVSLGKLQKRAEALKTPRTAARCSSQRFGQGEAQSQSLRAPSLVRVPPKLDAVAGFALDR